MKKQMLNLGKALNKAEQKQINGGLMDYKRCSTSRNRPSAQCPGNGNCINGECVPMEIPTNG
mgnify:CR=1 FL=1